MQIVQRQWYAPEPDQLPLILARGVDESRPRQQDLVEIIDGDGEMFGYVRADMAEELCSLLNNHREPDYEEK